MEQDIEKTRNIACEKFLDNRDVIIEKKTRKTGTTTVKRKYFRQIKIY